MSAVSFIVEMVFGDHPETGWIESAAIMISVTIIINVAAATDYIKERMFEDLLKSLDKANTKASLQNCELRVLVDVRSACAFAATLCRRRSCATGSNCNFKMRRLSWVTSYLSTRTTSPLSRAMACW